MDNIYFALAINVVLYFLLLGLQVIYRARSYGLGYALSSLDGQKQEKTCQSRVRRAKDNQTEFLVLLISLIVIMSFKQPGLEYTTLSAMVIIFARAVYVVTVLLGIPYLRSACWLISTLPLFYFLFAVMR